MQRPTGVTVLAILAIIGGILGILAGVSGLALGPALDASNRVAVLGLNGAALILGILELVIGIGLWLLKPWAWSMAVIVFVLEAISRALGLVSGPGLGPVLGLIVAGVILFYLFRPEVKAAFGRA